jgi:arylformamidase
MLIKQYAEAVFRAASASPGAFLHIKEVKRMADKGTGSHKSEWIDVSYPLSRDMLYWPNDPITPHIDWIYQPAKGHAVTMAQININVHNGTHVDAPRHFDPNGTPVDEMPLDTIMGPVRVIEIKDTESIKPEELILFKTINSSYYKLDKFVEDFVYISTEAARFLRDKKVSVVGLDYFAIGSFLDHENLVEVHKTLVGNGIWVIETIDLSAVQAGQYEIICLPIKLTQGDGAPARVILRPL